MAINFKDIKENYFDDYKNYWIVFFIIVLFLFLNSYRIRHFGTKRITMGIENAVYITSGVAINEKYVIADKDLVENKCIGIYSGLLGSFYVVTKNNIYRAVIDAKDVSTNIVLLRLSRKEDRLSHYSILEIDQPKYDVNKRLIVPITLNKPGYFLFKNARIVADVDNDFFVSVNNTPRKDNLNGMPVFNKNYVLQGIVNNENNEYQNKIKRDEIMNNLNLEQSYYVNGLVNLKKFLDKNEIEYYVISDINNLEKDYKIKDSVVNIICVKVN